MLNAIQNPSSICVIYGHNSCQTFQILDTYRTHIRYSAHTLNTYRTHIRYIVNIMQITFILLFITVLLYYFYFKGGDRIKWLSWFAWPAWPTWPAWLVRWTRFRWPARRYGLTWRKGLHHYCYTSIGLHIGISSLSLISIGFCECY